jgi:hypothetical protein
VKRYILASWLALSSVAAAPAAEGPTVSIATEYLGTLKISLGKAQMIGTRIIYEAKGCTLEGPNIKAACISPSADWQMAMPDGSLRLDIRATLKTEGGELIFLEGSGIRSGGYDVLALRYVTDSQSLGWLNTIQSVAKRVSSGAAAGFDIFVVR